MRILRTAAILVSVAVSLTGCDFFRSLVGKPTSAELELMRIEAQKKIDREKFVADSIKAALEEAQRAAQEEAERLAALAQAEEELPKVTDNDPRYNVIAGCFRVQENASNFRNFLEKSGYTPKRLVFKNGYDVVSVYQTDRYGQAIRQMEEFMALPYCPDDVWIYDLNQGLHE